jgi:secretion/DNA translocation related CpaE-like protein
VPVSSSRPLLPPTSPTGTSAILLVTDDEALAGEVTRLAAAAGAAVDRRRSADAVAGWNDAAAVLVGSDHVHGVAAAAPPRRDGVFVIAFSPAPDPVFRSAVGIGATSVVELPDADEWLVGTFGDLVDDRRPVGAAVGVVGGSGGAGTTVLAAALALTAGQTGAAMLVDLDPLGPGLCRLIGIEDATGATWETLADSQGRLGSRSLREALPRHGEVAVLGWPDRSTEVPSPALLREVVAAGRRGHDWLVIDIPRSGLKRGEAVSRCDHVLLVARAEVAAVASAARVARSLRERCGSVGVVVRTRRGGVLADDVAAALGLPLLAEVRDQRRLAEHLDLGLGPVHDSRSPLARASRGLLEVLGS